MTEGHTEQGNETVFDESGADSLPTQKLAFADARKKALGLLSRREHTVRELRMKLVSRGHEDAIVHSVIDFLVNKDFLSDRRFAEEYVRSRINKGYGERDIRARLSEKGVNESLIAAVLAEQSIDWTARAVQVLQKKLNGLALSTRTDGRARYARFLQSRGFSSEQTLSALKQIADDDESEVAVFIQ